jgi:hypothetical protein
MNSAASFCGRRYRKPPWSVARRAILLDEREESQNESLADASIIPKKEGLIEIE